MLSKKEKTLILTVQEIYTKNLQIWNPYIVQFTPDGELTHAQTSWQKVRMRCGMAACLLQASLCGVMVISVYTKATEILAWQQIVMHVAGYMLTFQYLILLLFSRNFTKFPFVFNNLVGLAESVCEEGENLGLCMYTICNSVGFTLGFEFSVLLHW